MAQDILITPGITEPQILFRGSGASTTAIELNVLAGYQSASGVGSALVFEGTEGQLFAITDNLSTGTIFSVSDISGLPLISVDASGGVHLGEYADTVTVYPGLTIDDYVPATTTNKLYNDGGSLKWNGITVVESGASQVVDGTGTASYIAKWTDTNTIGTGVIYDDGTNVGIGTTNPQFNLDVEADLNSTTYIRNYNTNAGSTAGAGILAQGDNAKSFFIAHAVNRVSTRYGFTLGNTTEIAAGGNTASTEGLVIGTLSYDKPIIFGNDDTERMRIDVGGNIGIGTTSPFGLFDVQQNTVSSLLSRLWNTNTSGTGSSVFRITNSGNNAYGSRIEFSDTNYYVGTITADRTNGIQFFTGNQSAATDNFRMVIDPDGDVGIGTSAPNARLHVYDATSGADVFNAEGSSGSLFSVTDDLSGTLMSVNTISGFPVLEVNSDYSITAGRFNQNDFVLTTGGDIGIGTAGPSSKLEVQGTATATSFLVPGGGSNQFLKADGSIDSTAYTTCAGTVTSVAAGNGLNFTTITGSGSVVLGTPGSTTLSSTNAVTTTSHTHAFAPGGTTAQYIRGDGSLSTFPTIPTVNNGTLTMGVSGTGLAGSASFTANQSGNSSFTVTSNATSLNTASTIVSRDASGNFSAGTITANLSGNATTATTATTATNANNINISATTSTDTTSSIVLVGAQSTGNQSPFIDSGLSYNSDTNALTAGSFVKTSGTSSQFLKADGSVDSTAYSTCAGTVTSVAAGNGLNFTTITGSGSVVLGTPGSTTLSSTNAVSATSHTHAFAPGGTTAQYIRGDGSLATFPSIPTVNNGTLTMGVSGTGLTGSATFTANQSGGSTFTVSSNATSANTVSTIVARDASGNFSASTITANLSGTATNANNINISATTSTDTTTSIVLVANQSTGNQSPFIDSGIAYNANTGALTAGSFIKTSGTSSQFLKADGSVDSTSYQASSTALTTSTSFGGDVSGTYNSIVVADDSHNHVISNVDGLQTALNNKLETSLKGANSGLAELDATGKVPSAQLPSFVDDVLEYANVASFPTTGETGKIYVALDTNLTYRWGGTSYVEISASLALGETSTTAYRGDRGKTAYDHSQATSGSVHGSTTVGGNLFRLTDPSAIRFLRINADNSISTLTDADFRAAIGAGTSSTTGTVTSVGGTGTVSGISLGGTVTTSGNLTLSGTLSVTPSNFASQTAKTFLAAPNASNGVPSFRTIVASDVPTLNQNTTGSAGSISTTVAAGTDANLVYASVAANDFFRIRVGGASNAAYAEIATADDGTEPIYVRQYTGVFATVARTATLLDSSGNTSFPGSVTGNSFVKSGGTSSQFLKADGSVDSTSYTTCAGTVTSVAAGNGLNFTTITGSGSVVLGTPGSTTLSSTNAVTTTSHTHAFAPGGTTAQYIRGDGSLATFPSIPTVNNGTLTMGVSGTGLSGSASFTANQSGNSTFTVSSNATSANTVSTIVARDASGDFCAGTITANQVNVDNLRLDGSTLSNTYTNGNINILPNGSGGINLGSCNTLFGAYPTVTGGSCNCACWNYATVSGGYDNLACGNSSSIGGGGHNCALGIVSTIAGGGSNSACATYSTIGGGQYNLTNSRYSVVAGGQLNIIYCVTNECCILSATIGGGLGHNTVGGTVDAGGQLSGITSCLSAGSYSTIGGGYRNCAIGYQSTIAGGANNYAVGCQSTIAGGNTNKTTGTGAFIGGGGSNCACSNYSSIVGGVANSISSACSAIAGGSYNCIQGELSAIVAGYYNCNCSNRSFIGSGYSNTVSGQYSTIIGGCCNNDCGFSNTHILGSNICATQANTTYTEKLLVSDTASANCTIFSVEGTNGSLFGVTDSLSGVLMSVNTVAGLPVLEVNSDYSVVAGRYSQDDFVITSGGDVGIGTNAPSTKLEVSGSVTATSFIKSGGTSSQFLKADGSVDSTAYSTCSGTVTSVAAGNGLNFTTITGSGSVTLGTPGSTTLSSTNAVTTTSHTHAFAPGGTTAQYIRGDGSLATFPSIPTVNNGTLTMGVSGTGLSGSATFTANQSGNSTFTVSSNATSANTASTIVARDGSGNFSAGTITASLSGNASTATTATNANNINISATTSTDTTTSIVLVANQATGNQSPFIDSGIAYNANTSALTAGSFIKTSGTSSQFLKADGSVDSTAYTTCAGTVTSVAAGNGLNFTTITGSGSVTLGTPGSTTLSSTNAVTATSHTHAFAPGGTTAQYIRGDGSLATFPASTTVNDGTLTLGVSGTGLTGSATFTANDADNVSFTVSSNATSANTASTIVARDASGNFSAGTISGAFSASADQAIVNQENGTTSVWRGRILSKNSSADTSAFLGTYGSNAGVFAHNNALSAWDDLYVNTVNGTSGGIVRMPTGVLINGQTAWHAGNDGTGSGLDADKLDGLDSATANTASTIVARDASGNFSAGTITASLSGNASTATTATNANNINISATESSDTTTFPTLVGSGATGNQSPFIDAGLSYNAQSNTLVTGVLSAGQLNIDNLRIDGNTLSSTNTNGYVVITPNGVGAIVACSTGDSRGSYAIDLQRLRATTAQVASGGCSVIGGGRGNTASNIYTVAVGGRLNTASGNYASVLGGNTNQVTGHGATIAGGITNCAAGRRAAVGGGQSNSASNCYSAVAGGYVNLASGHSSTISGGYCNQASGDCSSIAGGSNNNTCGFSNTHILGSNICATQANTTYTEKLLVSDTASANCTIFNVEGTNGSLFSIVDSLSGVLMSVNNNAGLPIFEVYDNDSIIGGRYNQNDFVVTTGGDVGIGTNTPSTKFEVSGSATATSFIKSGGTSSQFLKADGSVDSTSYTTCAGTVTSVAAGNGLNFTTITGSGSVTLGTPGSTTLSSTNAVTSTSHTHAFAPGGTTAQYIRGDGSLATFPSIPTVNNGTLTLGVSGTGLSGSASFTANQSGNSTFTVNSNATSANTASTIVARDASGNFSAGTITATLSGNASTVTNGVYTTGNQTVGGVKTFSSKIINTAAHNAATGGGQIYLNGTTGNRIDWNLNGVAAPTFTTRSAGTKIVLYPALNASSVDYALGIEGNTLWSSIPNTTGTQFKWYGGTTNIATLTGAGVLTVAGSTSQINVDNLRLDGNTLSSTNTNGNVIITPNGTGGIAGGTSATVTGQYAVVGGGYGNTASGCRSTIGGGCCNQVSNSESTISGGHTNCITSPYGTVGGGINNTITGSAYYGYHTIAGGSCNTVSAYYGAATVGGGQSNTASAGYATVSGGQSNSASGCRSTISGGFLNTTSGSYSTVGGGGYNTTSGIYATIAGGRSNTACGCRSTIGGGNVNTASGAYSSILGGVSNKACSTNSSVSGGRQNFVNARHGSINGGHYNVIQSPTNECCARGATIGGGIGHNTSGGTVNSTTGDITGTVTCCNAGAFSTISGGCRNIVTGHWSTVSGGYNNTVTGNISTTGGGGSNNASDDYSTVGGGYGNTASGLGSVVAGGGGSTASGSYSNVGGGFENTASAYASSVGGGCENTASGYYSTVSGGVNNCACGYYSTISGGFRAKASRYGEVAHAAGQFAQRGDAQHSTFVARKNTTDATANVELFLDGSSQRMTLTAETTWTFDIKLSAYNDTDNTTAWWIIRGGIRRNAANGTTLIGSLIEERDYEGTMSGTSAAVTADDTNESLKIAVTGLASKNIRWVAVVDVAQVSWGTP